MVTSMTGFGRILKEFDLCKVKVEIKTVNSKVCDINIRMPRLFSHMEIPIRALIQTQLQRGKIDLFMDIKLDTPIQKPSLNQAQFMSAMSILKEMKQAGDIDGKIKLEHVLTFPDMISYEEEQDLSSFEPLIIDAVNECLNAVQGMRDAEGAHLKDKIDGHLEKISLILNEVQKATADIYSYWVARFKSRMEAMTDAINEERIVQEASLHAEKADIKEEIERVGSHLKQFKTIMNKEFPCGNKLNFLCQELYREWNTIASKSINADIINSVIEAKALVDSIKEQVQNIA